MNLSNQARWDVVLGGAKDSNAQSAAISQLTLNDGIVNLLDKQVESIEVKELKGTGGTVNVVTTVNENGTLTTPVLQVGTVESSAGSPTVLALNYTGITSDYLTAENTKDLKALDIASGTASVSEYVQEGDINGAWTRQDGEGDGSFQTNTKLTDFSSVNAMSLVQWRNEINHLTKRLGDIRASEGTIGAWARVYGGESQWGGANEVKMDHTTIQVGGDYRINNHWIAGAAFSYTDSRADLSNGDADGDSYSLAVYGTYTADGGSFLDLIARYGYLKNDVTAGNMALDTSSNAFSLSAEMGHTFRFINDAAYVEPQIEFTYGFIGGDDATASNSVRIEQDDFQSFVTRVGVRAGYDFPQKKGSVYGMFSYSYDWMGDADGTASKDGLRQALSQDLGGGWVTYGVGAQIMLGDSAYFYGELERTSGGDIDNPYLFSAGVRMTF
ncbi:MAG: autotransporter outer membrane beta-barrel domain-containing protein [Duodenibacillus sp.]|nr:autotransporter outer membrane beta-barrel domain-containing protein [Duodenibacillus sp.]